MRLRSIAALCAILAASHAVAQDTSATAPAGPSAGPPGRYAIAPAGDGFVRLDTQTGMVSHCGRRDGRWSCEPAAESSGEVMAALDDLRGRIDALGSQVTALSAEVAGLRQRTDALEADTLKKSDVQLTPDEANEMERFTDQVMRRLFGLVAQMKRAEKSP